MLSGAKYAVELFQYEFRFRIWVRFVVLDVDLLTLLADKV